MAKEVERKFLMHEFPTGYPIVRDSNDLQGYLSINPEVRLRKSCYADGAIKRKLSVKSEGDLSREEVEWYISESTYDELYDMIDHKLITKEYKKYLLPDGHYLEVSLVDGETDHAFMYAEIEFSSEEEANNFVLPSCLGKEITYDKSYKMKNYWLKTRL
jgi:CYTH domain-containing protein